ncbi:helix-turn-helix transcriptional regulator [Vibrio metschnikovii]|nr:helix-turn-helix transcriptional regulator [Vibrio metschnikovii]
MIGDVLKQARIKINLSQSEMASKVGVTKQTYMKWENNITEPKASQVTILAKLLNITEKEICRGKLNRRMSLSAFIHRMNLEKPSQEMETLKLWENADDHEELFESMQPKTEDEYYGMKAEEEFVSDNRW